MHAEPHHETARPTRRAEFGEVKELRLAVVCYGGVSLAIYMHGHTKEIHGLVRASRILEDGDRGAAVAGPQGSEGVYVEVLRAIAAEHPDRVRTRVVVDTIAGTSAGGINGVYLGKAIAHNRSQDELRNLWLDRGDINVLLRGPKLLPWQLRGLLAVLRLRRSAPLHGDLMSQWLYQALAAMDKRDRRAGEPATLMPPLHSLQLFVTATDFYGYSRDIILTEPDPTTRTASTAMSDWRHRHVLEFRYDGERDDFGANDNVALAFASRVTSSFPGAFAPVSFESFAGYLKEADVRFPPPEFDTRYFRHYGLSRAKPDATFFVDGGVLDNKPFGLAIGAIKAKHAATEVDRRLLYLEPHPATPGTSSTQDEPGPLSTVLGAVAGIPRKEPLLEDLLDVARHNDRVRRVRDVIEMSFDGVATRVLSVIGGALEQLPPTTGADMVDGWGEKIHHQAQHDAGFGYATYIRLKIGGVVDRYARAVCAASNFPDDCNQAFFVRMVLRSWADRNNLFEKSSTPTAAQDRFLREFDLEFRKRRLHFVIAGLNWFYRDRALGKPDYPPRQEIDAVKGQLYAAIRRLDEAVARTRDGDLLSATVRACFGQEAIEAFVDRQGFHAARYAEQHHDPLNGLRSALNTHLKDQLKGFTSRVFDVIHQATGRWSAARRRDLLVRYLGFPFWDVLLYPLEAVADAGERDHVQVIRMSPRDATLLGRDGEAKLKGIALHHFGAFFARKGRENDYLWGRLDAAERLIELLVGRNHPRFTDWCRRAFEAVLEEERSASPPLSYDVLTSIDRRLDGLRSGPRDQGSGASCPSPKLRPPPSA